MWLSSIPYNRSSLSLLDKWDAWFVIHEEKFAKKIRKKMQGTFNEISLFMLTVIGFLCYRETAGDSGLPKDSNTVVGKPQLGEQS